MGRAFTSLSMQTVAVTSNGTVTTQEAKQKLSKSINLKGKNSNKNKNPKVLSLDHSVLTWLQALTTNTADGLEKKD